MKRAAPFDKLLDRFEEGEGGRIGLGPFLPVAGRAGQMSQTLLLGARRVCEVARVASKSAVVWSVGPDGQDDDGDVTDTKSGKSVDVGFVLKSQ
jgi:hypothetical protein